MKRSSADGSAGFPRVRVGRRQALNERGLAKGLAPFFFVFFLGPGFKRQIGVGFMDPPRLRASVATHLETRGRHHGSFSSGTVRRVNRG